MNYIKISKEKNICYICENECEYFLNKSNVVGVGLGYKITNGRYTCEKCIKVFVIKKISNSYLPISQRIPSLYKGIKTDVVESGAFKSSSLVDRVRPCTGGYNISNTIANSLSGTFGGLVKDKNDYYMLSNNHILAMSNTAPLGSFIVQPGINYGGQIGKDSIATLSKYVPIKFLGIIFKPTNYVDCAVAKIISKSLVSPKITFLGIPKGITDAYLNQTVKKVGAISELTMGSVISINASVKVEYEDISKEALFKKQIVTSKMNVPGDSGSLLMDNSNCVIGLCMSNSDSNSTFNPIKIVLQLLNVELVTS